MYDITARTRKISRFLLNLHDFWRRYRKNRVALLGLFIILFFATMAITASIISIHNPFRMNFDKILMTPSLDHPMGTDRFGRDLLSRFIWGARVSLFIGFASTGLATGIGILLGAISGYFGGKIDIIINRTVEIFMSLPTFFIILTVVYVLGSSIWNVMLILGLTRWPGTTRLIRAQFISLKEKEFVEACRVVGASDWHIIAFEILPNAIFPAIVNASMQVAGAILTEASLSFLGLGDPNQISWGWMLNDAMKSIRHGWWVSAFPGLGITLTVLAFNLIGDGLNDALNPYLKER